MSALLSPDVEIHVFGQGQTAAQHTSAALKASERLEFFAFSGAFLAGKGLSNGVGLGFPAQIRFHSGRRQMFGTLDATGICFWKKLKLRNTMYVVDQAQRVGFTQIHS